MSGKHRHPIAKRIAPDMAVEACVAAPDEYPFAHQDPDQACQDDAAEHYAATQRLEELAAVRAREVRSVGQLIKRPVVERQFLIGPTLLPKHGRMLVTGMSGTGKSTLTLYLSACLATGTPLFGILNRHKGENLDQPIFPICDESIVLYLDYELSEDIRTQMRLRPLLEQFGDDAQKVAFQSNVFFSPHPSLYRLHNQKGEATDKGSYDALCELVKSVRPDVLILDPLSSTHSLEENTIVIKQALNNVDRLIDLYGCAAILVHHSTTKSKTDANGKPIAKSTIQEPRGHSSLVDWCDVHMHFAEEKTAQNDEENEQGDMPVDRKIIAMTFGKARYSRCPEKRRLTVDFEAMRVEAVRKNER